MAKRKNIILGMSWVACAMVLFPITGYTATDASNTSEKSTSNAVSTAQAVTPQAETIAGKVTANVSRTLVGREGTRASSGKDAMVSNENFVMEEKIPTVETMEEVKGEVTALGADEIGILYKRTETAEYEKRIPLDTKVKFVNFKSLKELALGDEIVVEYEKTVQYPNEPREKRFMTAKSITLVKKYKPEEGSQEKTV